MSMFDCRTLRASLLPKALATLLACAGIWSQVSIAQSLPDINVEDARAQAKTGDPTKQAALGIAMLLGRRMAKNEAEGLQWLKLAADQNHPIGLTFLGYAYLNGVGTEKNVREGIALTRRAAELGFAAAQVTLAQMYYEGRDVDRDDRALLKWATLAAEQGDAGGQRILGVLYAGGRGVAVNFELALDWLGKAANQGDVLAKNIMPTIVALRDAEKSPSAVAKTLDFIQKNANEGNATAQYELSVLYLTGDGVAKDDVAAQAWERKAAAQDHPQALAAVANRLIFGTGVKADFWKGYSSLYRAGALGHAPSQRLMGALYKTGTGVKPDPIEAVKWFNIAIGNGDARAAQLRDETVTTLKPADLVEAQRRTDVWLKKTPNERLNP